MCRSSLPNLADLSITPRSCAPCDTFECWLATIAQFYPRIKHLEVRAVFAIDLSWVPSAKVAKVPDQVASIEFIEHIQPAEGVDRLLKHASALV